ncbi:MAG: hypothetical protein HFJ40_07175 [Clostridia bacterium]|mgnify:CR=1 FL=1|nr:hypothetical protein [Clostridia bacterium]
MGTYYIPRNVKGETRILYIFTIKALITTAGGIILGALLYFLFLMLRLKVIGIACIVICAVLGYGIGMIKIPTLSGIKFTKKIGGEPLSEIIIRYFKFIKNKKTYTYVNTQEKEEEEER